MPLDAKEFQFAIDRYNDEQSKNIRTFSSGATRSPLGEKLQYEGYLIGG